MVICQGDVFWTSLSPSSGSEPAYKRPVVIVQRDSINRSKFRTVVVVPLTKQTKHAILPGNVLLKKGEANLPRPSLARGTHVMDVDKKRMIVKVAGGASIMDDMNYFRIGQKNITALRKMFWRNNVIINGEDIGKNHNRTVQLRISTGKLLVKNSANVFEEL